MQFKNIPIYWAEKEIPKGQYCYSITGIDTKGKLLSKTCPFWHIRLNAPEQENGFCSLLNRADNDEGLSLLWDQVKECGINDSDDDMDSESSIISEIIALPVKIKN